ncbi:hypothetical protein GCM10010967_36400 [Dyadobacter beijingensis]|uniref:Uncharacterized protein n=1 Tax=Dyadobacter beijingensis TaxID=365489 RepID=A0ABQ2I3I9_9BACT|nr:hypothetical protein GCM10010967_36400 [Dyadobacter beijingensis]
MKAALKETSERYETKVDHFAKISRDARTHLSLIDARIEKAFRLVTDDQMARHHLGQARSNSQQLIQLLNGFLAYETMENGGLNNDGEWDGQTLFPPGATTGSSRFSRNELAMDEAVFKDSPGFHDDEINEPEPSARAEKRYSVLLIEDNEELRAFESELLSRKYQVMEASNCPDGLKLALINLPDLILCDVELPQQGGIQICSQLKADTRTAHIPIILLTGQNALGQVIQALRAGADDYLVQPVDINILLLKIQNLINARTVTKGLNGNGQSAGSNEWITSGANEEFIEKLRSLLIQNISQPNFGVNELAFQVGMSVSVLYRKVRSLTGMTVNDFMKTVKMERALQLLESGGYQVNEVALMVGYESVRYFSNEFKRIHGKNPSKVRNQSGGN